MRNTRKIHENSLDSVFREHCNRIVKDGEIGFYDTPTKCCISSCETQTQAYLVTISWKSHITVSVTEEVISSIRHNDEYQIEERPLCPTHLQEYKILKEAARF